MIQDRILEMLKSHDVEMVEMGILMYFNCEENIKHLIKDKFHKCSTNSTYTYYCMHNNADLPSLHHNIYTRDGEAVYFYFRTIYLHSLEFLRTINALERHKIMEM